MLRANLQLPFGVLTLSSYGRLVLSVAVDVDSGLPLMDSPNQSVLACMVRLDLLVSIESFHHRWPENEAKPYFYTCRLQGQTGLILSSSWRMLKVPFLLYLP